MINPNRVYTSYFANVKNLPNPEQAISIARYAPPFWHGKNLLCLAPTTDLLQDYREGKITWGEYSGRFLLQLRRVDPYSVIDMVKGSVLLCWEKDFTTCHRTLVLEWLADHFGDSIIGGEVVC